MHPLKQNKAARAKICNVQKSLDDVQSKTQKQKQIKQEVKIHFL